MEPVSFTIKPSLKMYFSRLTLMAFVSVYLLFVLVSFPHDGFYVHQFLDVENHWLRRHLLSLLYFKITYGMIAKLILLILAGMGTVVYYYYLEVKSISYTFTNKFLAIAKGIATKEEQTIDMVDVRDEELVQHPLELGLHLASILIKDKNKKNEPPLWLHGLHKLDAHKALDHIRIYRTETYTDYKHASDMMKDPARGGKATDKPPVDEVDENFDDQKHQIDN